MAAEEEALASNGPSHVISHEQQKHPGILHTGDHKTGVVCAIIDEAFNETIMETFMSVVRIFVFIGKPLV